MRNAAFLLVALTVGVSLLVGADGALASAVLTAKSAEERAVLLRGQNSNEMAAALGEIEKTAGARFDAKDYPQALNAYEAAVTVAGTMNAAAKLPLYFRRIGLCHAYQGQTEAALAAYRSGVSASEAAGDDPMLAENLHGVAQNLQTTGRYREALPFCERELALTDASGQPEAMIRARATYSQVLGGLGRLRDALPVAERAFELSPRSSRPTDYANTLGNLAITYAELGDDDTALRLEQTNPKPTPSDLAAIAVIEVHLHREIDAEASYRAAIAASTDPGLWRIHAATLLNLGTLQHQLKKLPEARSSVEQSLAVLLPHDDLRVAADALSELSEIAADEKKPEEALRQAAEALRVARESENPEGTVNGLVAQARAFEAAGRNDDAGRAFGDAVSLAESRRADAPASAAGLQSEIGQWIPTYQFAVSHEIATGNALAALKLADRAKARVLLDMLDGGEPGFDALTDPAERAEEQQLRGEVSQARLMSVTRPAAGSGTAFEAALRKEEDFNVRLYARHPELVLQRAEPPEITPQDLAALTPDSRTAVLSYFMLQDSVALFVVRRGDRAGTPVVKAFQLASGDRLEALIRSFRAQIAARDLDYRLSAKALYNALIGPAEGALQGADRWILSPDGALWDVPFQALMDPHGKHVLETHKLSYAPSLSVLKQLRGKPAASGPARGALLVMANPAVKGVAPIPEAEREAGAIAALYGPGHSTLLTGDRANASLFRENAERAGVIHIASHAETETNHPLESFLLLAPDKASASAVHGDNGALTARDLLTMRLTADLVVLSACETARGKIGQGDGVMGLGWAALAAGARASVLSQWKVDSRATTDLMIGFHQQLTGRKIADKAEALRQASLAVMRSPGRLHPFYWAGFIVVGDAR